MAELRVPYLNNLVVIGRVTADPDLRYTPAGTPVLTFRIAVNRRYKDRSSEEWKEDTYFFTATAWAQLAERLAEKMKRGAPVLVQGELRSRSWDSPSGEKRSAVEIMARGVAVMEKTGATGADAAPAAPGGEDEPEVPRDQLDDIPF
jgi:single-strand DNA-binding protein